MSSVQEKRDEIYLNYDTAWMYRESESEPNVIDLFQKELDYPAELTSSFLKFNKSYLKSVIMRIKVSENMKIKSNDVKNNLLEYNKELKPILDKLLTEKFIKQYEEVMKVENKIDETDNEINKNDDVDVNDDDDDVHDEEDESNSNDILNNFLEEWVEETKSQKDFIKVTKLFEAFNEYCDENETDKINKSIFKNYLVTKWGNSVNSGYKGIKLIEED